MRNAVVKRAGAYKHTRARAGERRWLRTGSAQNKERSREMGGGSRTTESKGRRTRMAADGVSAERGM
jgi:hypothetical protein